eukprot:scaffold180443_cov31-Tisochrysis_lutea.AAC.6
MKAPSSKHKKERNAAGILDRPTAIAHRQRNDGGTLQKSCSAIGQPYACEFEMKLALYGPGHSSLDSQSRRVDALAQVGEPAA